MKLLSFPLVVLFLNIKHSVKYLLNIWQHLKKTILNSGPTLQKIFKVQQEKVLLDFEVYSSTHTQFHNNFTVFIALRLQYCISAFEKCSVQAADKLFFVPTPWWAVNYFGFNLNMFFVVQSTENMRVLYSAEAQSIKTNVRLWWVHYYYYYYQFSLKYQIALAYRQNKDQSSTVYNWAELWTPFPVRSLMFRAIWGWQRWRKIIFYQY